MDRISATVDVREFTKALQEYVRESSMDAADAVNKKAGDVAFKAAQSLPTVAEGRGKIQRIGKKNRLWNAIASGGTRLGISKKGKAVRGKGNADLAKEIYESRLRHVPYSRAIFLTLAAKMGKKVSKVRKSSSIDNAIASKAKTGGAIYTPKAILEILGIQQSHSPVMVEALTKGLANQVQDMKDYIARKIAKRAQAHSGR
jgi:hypothetical protein